MPVIKLVRMGIVDHCGANHRAGSFARRASSMSDSSGTHVSPFRACMPFADARRSDMAALRALADQGCALSSWPDLGGKAKLPGGGARRDDARSANASIAEIGIAIHLGTANGGEVLDADLAGDARSARPRIIGRGRERRRAGSLASGIGSAKGRGRAGHRQGRLRRSFPCRTAMRRRDGGRAVIGPMASVPKYQRVPEETSSPCRSPCVSMSSSETLLSWPSPRYRSG